MPLTLQFLSGTPSGNPVGLIDPSSYCQSYFARTSVYPDGCSVRPALHRPTLINSLNVLGRLQREVACVPRPASTWEAEGEELDNHPNFWSAAVKLLTAHATRKQELEVGFQNEEGTGLGPTMEFYALLSAEFMQVYFRNQNTYITYLLTVDLCY